MRFAYRALRTASPAPRALSNHREPFDQIDKASAQLAVADFCERHDQSLSILRAKEFDKSVPRPDVARLPAARCAFEEVARRHFENSANLLQAACSDPV